MKYECEIDEKIVRRFRTAVKISGAQEGEALATLMEEYIATASTSCFTKNASDPAVRK